MRVQADLSLQLASALRRRGGSSRAVEQAARAAELSADQARRRLVAQVRSHLRLAPDVRGRWIDILA